MSIDGAKTPWPLLGTGPVASAKARPKISIKWTLRAGNTVVSEQTELLF